MSLSRLTGLTLVSSALALAACTPTWPDCKTDDHCNTEGHVGVCVEGKCQECGRDADCKSGFACQANKCVPKPECSTDPECPPGRKCRDNKCVPECSADTDCAKGMVCKSGRCTPPAECGSDADCPAGKKCQAGKCAAEEVSGPTDCTLQTVRFEFNEFNLTPDARRTLDANADCLKQKKMGVTLAGHADERGTEEYNLHLGEKRANSVKKYLVTLGVESGKLKTVSYGEERPASNGHDEGAWAENRRVEFNR